MDSQKGGSEGAASPQQEQDKPVVLLRSPFERKKDVFDAEDFEAVKLINQLYPDGEIRCQAAGL